MALKKIKLEKMQNFLDDINSNFSQTFPLLTRSDYPNELTVAQGKGQLYFNTSTGGLYLCSSIIDNTTFIWNQVSGLNKYSVLSGITAPESTIHADGVGQLYIDTLSNKLYLCSAITNNNSDFTWAFIATGNVFPIIVSQDGIIQNNIAKGVGQLLVDFTTNNLYMCIGKEEQDDIWYPINTGKQQFIYSTNEPMTTDESVVWMAKNRGQVKNTDGETTPVPEL